MALRMDDQIDGESGMLRHEMTHSNCLHFQMLGLQGWVTIAHISRVSLWPKIRGPLLKALRTNVPALNPSWQKCRDKPLSPIQADTSRFAPLRMLATTPATSWDLRVMSSSRP